MLFFYSCFHSKRIRHHKIPPKVRLRKYRYIRKHDLNGDGKVEPWEIKEFYEKYGSNKNGVLEEEKIEAAVD